MQIPKPYTSLLSISLFFLFSCGGSAPPVQSDWIKENLQGKVKTISSHDSTVGYVDKILGFNVGAGPIVDHFEVFSYNEKGFITQQDSKNGTTPIKKIYTYDSSNRLKKMEFIILNSDGKQVSTYEYNRKGRLIKQIDEIHFENNSSDKQITVYKTVKFDNNGRILKSLVETDDKKNDYYILNTYDQKGNRLSNEIYDMNDKLKYSFLYTYNERGDVLTEKSKLALSGGQMEEKKYTYDEKGNMLSVSYTISAMGQSNSSNATYEYTFDSKGNWIERVCIESKTKRTYTKRMIEYY